METKICRTCGVEHSLSLFHTMGPKGRQRPAPDCNTCRSTRRREQSRKLKADAIEYKGGKCEDCHGVFHQSIYEFHHLDPTTKDKDPAHLLQDAPRLTDKMIAELDKCILLCANCHRVRHWLF